MIRGGKSCSFLLLRYWRHFDRRGQPEQLQHDEDDHDDGNDDGYHLNDALIGSGTCIASTAQ